jgi:biotin operon repressor
MELIATHNRVSCVISLEDGSLLAFDALNPRRERTGVHATLRISLDGAVLAWTLCNVERSEERTRLARKAHRMLGEMVRQLVTEADLTHWVDEFCARIWDAYTDASRPVDVVPEDGPPAEPLLQPPILVERGGTILFGPPGRGKSYTALVLAVALDAGVEAGVFRPRRPVRAIYVNLERPRHSLARRLRMVNLALGLAPDRPLRMLNARGRTYADIHDILLDDIQRHGIGLVVLDSISRAGLGTLNEDITANRLMDSLNALGVAWLALAHTPRADPEHAYGSIMQDAAADIVVRLVSQSLETKLGVGLQVTKANDLGKVPMSIMCLEFANGQLQTVRKARSGEFADIEAERPRSLSEQIMELLLDVGQLTASQVAQELGYSREWVVKALRALTSAGQVHAFRKGHEVYYGAAAHEG